MTGSNCFEFVFMLVRVTRPLSPGRGSGPGLGPHLPGDGDRRRQTLDSGDNTSVIIVMLNVRQYKRHNRDVKCYDTDYTRHNPDDLEGK